MAEDLINSLINRPNAQKEIKETIVDLEMLQKQLTDTSNSVLTLNAALGKSTNSKDLSGNITKVNTELEKTVKIRKQITETIVSNSQAEVDAYNNASKGEKGITETVNARNKAEAQAANEATARSAKVIQQQQAQAKEYVRAQGLIERLNTKLKFYKQAQIEATDPRVVEKYGQKIQSTEANITKLSNAGKTGFDSLGNAVKKSSNLFSQIGQKAVTLARLLPGVGIVGLIAFATEPIIEYITQLDVFKKKAEEVAGIAASDGSEFKGALSAVNALKTSIDEFNEGTISGKLLVERYNETIGQTAGILQTTAEVEAFYNSRAKDYVQAMFLRAQANAALEAASDKLAEAQKRALGGPTFGDGAKAAVTNFFKLARGNFGSFFVDVSANQKKAVDKLNQSGKDGFAIYDRLKKEADKFAKDKGFGDLDGAKREQERKKAVEEAKRRAKELRDIAAASAKELLDLQNDYEKQLQEAQKRGEKAEEERLKQILKNSEAVFQQANSQRLLQIEKNESDALSLVADQYSKGILSKQEYEKEKSEIEFESNKENIESAIALSQSIIQLRIDQNEDLGTEEENLAKLQIKLSELVTAKKLSDADKVQARQKELNAKIKELAEEAAQFVITLANAGFENRKNQLQEQANAIDNNTQQEIKSIERSVGTEQQKADKIAIINAKAQADKTRIAQQQKQIDIEKAKFDKAIAIARIIENTAIGITAALTSLPPNVPLSFVIGAIGAIQLATAIAQPIPTYKDGTASHKGGWAIFGEAGTEAVIEPGKKPYLTSGATLGVLPTGTQVISNADLMNAMANPNSGAGYVSNQLNLSELLQQNERNTNRIEKALQIKQQSNYNVGYRNGKKFGEYLKRNIN